jgi:hypothetical protein
MVTVTGFIVMVTVTGFIVMVTVTVTFKAMVTVTQSW